MSTSNGVVSDSQTGGHNKTSYEKLLKSLQHTQAEKSLMLQEIQHLKSQLRKISSSPSSVSSKRQLSESDSPRATPTIEDSRASDDNTIDKLLESNLRFGMMATMWSIKTCLNKRIHRAFSHWRAGKYTYI